MASSFFCETPLPSANCLQFLIITSLLQLLVFTHFHVLPFFKALLAVSFSWIFETVFTLTNSISVIPYDITSVLHSKSGVWAATLEPPNMPQISLGHSPSWLFRLRVYPLGKYVSSASKVVDRVSPVTQAGTLSAGAIWAQVFCEAVSPLFHTSHHLRDETPWPGTGTTKTVNKTYVILDLSFTT